MKLCNDRWKIRNVENLYVQAKRSEEEVKSLEATKPVSKNEEKRGKLSKSKIADDCEEPGKSSKSSTASTNKKKKDIPSESRCDESNGSSVSMNIQKRKICQSQLVDDLKVFECKICNKVMSNRSNLRKHIGYMHMKIRRLHCDLCGGRFYERHQVRMHMINNHTVKGIKTLDQSRPLSCSKCPKRFNSFFELDQHQVVHQSTRVSVNVISKL